MLPGCNRILLISLAAGLLAGAEVYKWVDDNGVVHYTDTPPEGQHTTPIEVAPPAPAAPPPATIEPDADETNAAWYEQWQAEQRARKASEQAARDAERSARLAGEADRVAHCDTARQHLHMLRMQCPAFFDGQGILRVLCPYQPIWVFKGEKRYISLSRGRGTSAASARAALDISISSLPRAARTASTSGGHRRRHAQREMQNPNTR